MFQWVTKWRLLVAVAGLVLAFAAPLAQAITIYGVNINNQLVRFDSAAPGTIVSGAVISGTIGGEQIVAIDFRPQTEQLYGLGSSSRLYLINHSSGVATQVGTGGSFGLNGATFGFDFNPVTDRIRITSEADQNLRVNPNDGTLATIGSALAYAGGDAHAGTSPNIAGSAYTNSFGGATSSTLFGIDAGLDILVTQNPEDNGTLQTVGSLGVNADPFLLGFDIYSPGGTNTAFASLVVGGVCRLYTINLGTGAATLLGTVGGGASLRGIAVLPQGFTAAISGSTVTFTGGGANNAITFDASGGLLRHNRNTLGDSGFNSDYDFDTFTAGDQTISATDPSITIVVNAGLGDDTVIIGTNTAPSTAASSLAPKFQINGQGGGDSLTINDSTNSSGLTYTVSSTKVSATLGGAVDYAAIEALTLVTSAGADTVQINSTSAATSILSGADQDSFIFANGATLSGGYIDGGTGTNTLDYSAYTTAVTVDLHPVNQLLLATLSAAQEPGSPGALSHSPAAGVGVFLLNADQTALTFNITYKGLTAAQITSAYFANEAAGLNGATVRSLAIGEFNPNAVPNGNISGVWSATDASSLTGASPTTAGSTLVQEVLAGRVYFQIETSGFDFGEIRGQLVPAGAVGIATGTSGVRNIGKVIGGTANDSITGTTSGQFLGGGAGNDLFIWKNGDGSDVIDGDADADDLQINGSPGGDDHFLLQVNPADPTRLRFDRTNLGLFNLNIGTVELIEFLPLGGNDTATLDFAGGNPIPPLGLFFDGGDGDDRLVLQRSDGNYTAGVMSYVSSGPGAGTITIDGRAITYTNLTPIDDVVPATTFTFTPPSSAAAINIVDGPVVQGFATHQINSATSDFELVNFANKTNITVTGSSMPETMNLNSSVTPPGLNSLTLNTGSAADQINITAVPSGVFVSVNAVDDDDTVKVVGAGVPEGTTLVLDGGNGSDALTYESGNVEATATAGPGAGQTTVKRAGAGSVVYQNFEQVSIARAGVQLLKLTNATNNDGAPGPSITVGSTVTFTYVVSNTGNEPLANVFVLDDGGTPGDSSDDFDPTFINGDANGNGLLDPDENWVYTEPHVVTEGQYTNVAVVTANPTGGGAAVSASDADNHFGVPPGTPTAARLVNISTRLAVETGDNVLIGGFIITGSDPKKVIIRGIGPSLPVEGPLADPTLELHTASGAIVTNDNWRSDQEAEIQATTIPPSNDLESAIVATLPPGAHTAIVRGANGGTGVGLVEVYDLEADVPSELANISTRGRVQTGANVMIGGFIVGSGEASGVVIRAIGPSLPVEGALADPILELHDANGGVIINDNWRDTQESEIIATTVAPDKDLECAIVARLAPGNYTAIVRGKDDTTGIALVEAYNLR